MKTFITNTSHKNHINNGTNKTDGRINFKIWTQKLLLKMYRLWSTFVRLVQYWIECLTEMHNTIQRLMCFDCVLCAGVERCPFASCDCFHSQFCRWLKFPHFTASSFTNQFDRFSRFMGIRNFVDWRRYTYTYTFAWNVFCPKRCRTDIVCER